MAEELSVGGLVPATVVSEVRTRRLVLIGDDGKELAVLQLDRGVVELRIGEGRSAIPCSVTAYAGQSDDGSFAAGIELWASGNSIAGCCLSVTGDGAEVHHFG
jgi:hypothetical protein